MFSQVSVCSHRGGGGVPGTPSPSHNTSTGPMSFPGRGDTPVTGPRSLPRGVPRPGPDREGVPQSGPDGGVGGFPSQGVPWPGPHGGYPSQGWVPPPSRDGIPPIQRWGTPAPLIGQQMEYLIRGGRYASCVHAGGLSCFIIYNSDIILCFIVFYEKEQNIICDNVANLSG